KLTLDGLSRLEKDFTAEHLGRAITHSRMQQLAWTVVNHANMNRAQWFKDGRWTLPDTVLADAAKRQRLAGWWLEDAWGHPIKLVKRDKKRDQPTGWPQLDYYELVSAGPDGKFGSADDLELGSPNRWPLAQMWWLPDDSRLGLQGVRA